MSRKNACPEQCRDCKWHIRVKGLVPVGLHRCVCSGSIENGKPLIDVCADALRKQGGTCRWHEKVANDD